jgi:ABC-type cobalamin transport system ATPase subunit
MAKKYHYTETKMIRDIATVMSKNQGPFTKLMLVDLLSTIYPDKYKQELMNEISMAILTDKHCNKRFKVVRTGVWELAG